MSVIHRTTPPRSRAAAPVSSVSPDSYALAEPMNPLPYLLEPRALHGRQLCVVIPAYNEEQVLPRTHSVLAEALDRTGLRLTILIVNDGSRDRTADVLRRSTAATLASVTSCCRATLVIRRPSPPGSTTRRVTSSSPWTRSSSIPSR
jgi:cellulose synthase/poly-beta-1,6-N-acetylglucosamine synthase-like glycosyltransferase